MAGWPRVSRMVKRYELVMILMLFSSLAGADEDDSPSLELLEFLAEGTEVDGQWMDPVKMNELTQPSSSTLNEESQGDE